MTHLRSITMVAFSLIPFVGCADDLASHPVSVEGSTTDISSSVDMTWHDQSTESISDNAKSARIQQPPVGEGSAIEVSLDDLAFAVADAKAFDRSMLPEKVLDLVGKRIRVRGYMVPTLHPHVSKFVFFGETEDGPVHWSKIPLHLIVGVEMNEGRSVEFVSAPVCVEGLFSIEEIRHEDKVICLFKLNARSVERVSRHKGFGSPLWEGC